MFALRYKKIGAKIVFYRKLKSMTQEKLADEVGITPQYLSRIKCITFNFDENCRGIGCYYESINGRGGK